MRDRRKKEKGCVLESQRTAAGFTQSSRISRTPPSPSVRCSHFYTPTVSTLNTVESVRQSPVWCRITQYNEQWLITGCDRLRGARRTAHKAAVRTIVVQTPQGRLLGRVGSGQTIRQH